MCIFIYTYTHTLPPPVPLKYWVTHVFLIPFSEILITVSVWFWIHNESLHALCRSLPSEMSSVSAVMRIFVAYADIWGLFILPVWLHCIHITHCYLFIYLLPFFFLLKATGWWMTYLYKVIWHTACALQCSNCYYFCS